MKNTFYTLFTLLLSFCFYLELQADTHDYVGIADDAALLSPRGVYAFRGAPKDRNGVPDTKEVRLFNDSQWDLTNKKDRSRIKNWRSRDWVVLMDDPNNGLSGPSKFVIVNLDKRSYVKLNGVVTHMKNRLYIKKISADGSKIVLTDGSQWLIDSPKDQKKAMKWKVDIDYIIIGCSFDGLVNRIEHSYILINAKDYINGTTYVHAQMD